MITSVDNMWGNLSPHTLLVGMENGTATVANRQFFKRLNIGSQCDQTTPLLVTYINDMKAYIQGLLWWSSG